MPSIYLSPIVISRSNPFPEPTSTKQYVYISYSRKQRGPLIVLEPTTSTLRVRQATRCATPPLHWLVVYLLVLLLSYSAYQSNVNNVLSLLQIVFSQFNITDIVLHITNFSSVHMCEQRGLHLSTH